MSELHGALGALEEVRGKIAIARAGGSGDSDSASQYAAKIDALEKELINCKDDLKRDEEIFSEKVGELNRFRYVLDDLFLILFSRDDV